MYYYIAPLEEQTIIAKPLIRLLRSHSEIQSVVLSNIETLSATSIGHKLFEPHLRSFFVRSTDSTPVKLLKLQVLTSLASSNTISVILREFQVCVHASMIRICIMATVCRFVNMPF